jgi:hypothetical protein
MSSSYAIQRDRSTITIGSVSVIAAWDLMVSQPNGAYFGPTMATYLSAQAGLTDGLGCSLASGIVLPGRREVNPSVAFVEATSDASLGPGRTVPLSLKFRRRVDRHPLAGLGNTFLWLDGYAHQSIRFMLERFQYRRARGRTLC